MTAPIRIQRKRTRGWRMPEGAVYVGRPTLFGNPWTLADAAALGIPPGDRAAWCVRRYRLELSHLGLLSDYAALAPTRYEAYADRFEWPPEGDAPPSIVPLFREILKDATALVCWCPLDQPCHADALIELLA